MEREKGFAIADRIAGDPALQRAVAAACDLATLAQVLAAIEGSEEDWQHWLEDARGARISPPRWRLESAPPAGWIPISLFERGGNWKIEWVHSLFAPLSDPFFDDTVRKIARHPANLLLRCSTPAEAVLEFAQQQKPDVLIFHISRCGSTLVARMLGALEEARVLAEPPVFDAALQLYLRGVFDASLVTGVAGALTRTPEGSARRCALKLDPWHCLVFDQVAELFPGAHKVLLFRDPIEVLVSHRDLPGMQVLKGAVPYDTFGLSGAMEVAADEFASWAISAITKAALAAADSPELLIVDFAELPQAFTDHILPHCEVVADAAELARIAQVAGIHSKRPGMTFESDSQLRQEQAGAELRTLAARHGLDQLHLDLKGRVGRTR